MSTIITGVVIALIGVANLNSGRRHPERINARLQRRIGWVGIGCGLIVAICGAIVALRPSS